MVSQDIMADFADCTGKQMGMMMSAVQLLPDSSTQSKKCHSLLTAVMQSLDRIQPKHAAPQGSLVA